MSRQTMTVRVDSATRRALDDIATVLDRDRTYVVNEALKEYIDLHRWQIEHIRQGLQEANAGDFIAPAEIDRWLARMRKKRE